MTLKQRIFLYGNPVIPGSIGTGFQHCSRFEVTRPASPPEEALKFNTGKPDILPFGLETPHTEAVFDLLKRIPAHLPIGVSKAKKPFYHLHVFFE